MDEASVKEGKEEDNIWTDQANSPLDLVQELSQMKYLHNVNDPEIFKLYHVMAFCGLPTTIPPLEFALGQLKAILR